MWIEVLMIVFLTLLPFLELRASIPYGIVALGPEYWLMVFSIAVLVNIFLGLIIFFLLNTIVHLFLRIKFVEKIWHRLVEKAQKKVHPYIEKYGVFGLALFIGIPLPGSGVYTGALGAYLLGFEYKDFIKATIIGVLLAGILVTLISITGVNGFEIFVKHI